MNEIIFDGDKNAIKIGEVDELEAWYFHDRGSLLVGEMSEMEFNTVFAVGGTLLTEVAERFEEEFADAQLNDLGEALVEIDEVDELSEHGFTEEQIEKVTNC